MFFKLIFSNALNFAIRRLILFLQPAFQQCRQAAEEARECGKAKDHMNLRYEMTRDQVYTLFRDINDRTTDHMTESDSLRFGFAARRVRRRL